MISHAFRTSSIYLFRLRTVLFILIAAVSLTLAGCDSSATTQKNMSAYLQKTYGQEFSVGMPEFEGTNGMWPGVYTASATPKNLPDLHFTILWNTGDPTKNYDDTYMTTQWSAEAKTILEPILLKTFGKSTNITALHFDAISGLGGHYDSPNYLKMTFNQLKTYAPDKFHLDLKISIPATHSINKAQESKKIRSAFQQLYTNNTMEHYVFWVSYVSPDILKTYNPDDIKTAMDELHQEKKLINIAQYGTFPDSGIPIKNMNDIPNGFRY